MMTDFEQHLSIFIGIAIGFVTIVGFITRPLSNKTNELAERVKALELRISDWKERDHVPRVEYDRDHAIMMADHDALERLTERVRFHLDHHPHPSD